MNHPVPSQSVFLPCSLRGSVFPLAALLVAVGLLLLLSGCGQASRAESDPDDRADAGGEVLERVTVGKPQRQTLTLYTTQPGAIQAFEETPLYSKVPGYVEEIVVDIGDRVTEGDTLVKLWIPEMHDEVRQQEALVAQSEAELRQAAAALVAAQAAVKTASARVKGVEAGVVRAIGEWERWSAEFSRIKELASRGTVTEKLVDETLNQLRSTEGAKAEAEAAIESAQAALEEAESNVHKAEADRMAAEARLNVAHANLTRTRTMLEYGELKAPFDGVITRRNVDTRHYVHPSNGAGKPLVVITRTDKVRVVVDVPEKEAALVSWGEQGDPANITLQGLSEQTFDGFVTRTSWSLDVANRSLRTEIHIDNDDGPLRPGMYATVRIRLAEREDALTLPVSAVVRRPGTEPYCCVVKDGTIEHRRLELGLRSGNEFEILSGVKEIDTIVMARAGSLLPGQAVEMIKAP